MRPVNPDDARALVDGLAQLSPQSRLQRFLHLKTHLTADELRHMTTADGAQHLALGIVRLDRQGREAEGVAVAHVFRSDSEPEQGEFAIAVVDAWHGSGLGTRLTRALAHASRAAGIHRWQAVHMGDNQAVRRLLAQVGTKVSEKPFGSGAVEVVYALRSVPV